MNYRVFNRYPQKNRAANQIVSENWRNINFLFFNSLLGCRFMVKLNEIVNQIKRHNMDMQRTNYQNRQPKRAISDAAEFLGISMQAVHKQLKNKNINCEKIGNKSYLTFKTARDFF